MQNVPKVVLRGLRETAVMESHPEAELLSAFAERSLSQRERARVMEHLARCADCREVIALVFPEDECLPVPSTIPARQSWFSWPVLRWGFATVGILAVLSFGVLQYQQRQKHTVSLASATPLNEIASETAQSFPAIPGSQLPQAGEKPQPEARKRAIGNTNRLSGSEAEKVTARNQRSDQLVQNQADQSPQDQFFQNSDVVKAKAATAEPPAGSTAEAPDNALQTAPSLVLTTSPRWVVTAAGGLQRSFDAGQTWEDVNVNAETKTRSNLSFRTVVAIGPEVWAGGSGAVLYHSVDSGTIWQRVLPLPVGASPVGDITYIEFADPQDGKIATSAGETWTTSDNGRSWQRQP